jgi:hypothetical protein
MQIFFSATLEIFVRYETIRHFLEFGPRDFKTETKKISKADKERRKSVIKHSTTKFFRHKGKPTISFGIHNQDETELT